VRTFHLFCVRLHDEFKAIGLDSAHDVEHLYRSFFLTKFHYASVYFYLLSSWFVDDHSGHTRTNFSGCKVSPFVYEGASRGCGIIDKLTSSLAALMVLVHFLVFIVFVHKCPLISERDIVKSLMLAHFA